MVAILFIAIVCIILIQPTLIAIYTIFEKHFFWPYQNYNGSRIIKDGSEYSASAITEAVVYGFKPLASCIDNDGHKKMEDEFLVSPNRRTLALIGNGNENTLLIKCIWLYTRDSNNRVYYTCNNHTGIEIDLAGMWQGQLIVNAGFKQLYEKHQAWIQKLGIDVQEYDEGYELDEFMKAMRSRFDTMIHDGYIRVIDQKVGEWSYTIKGALLLAFKNYFVDLYRQMRGV